MKKKKQTSMIRILSDRSFRQNKSRNIVAVLAVLLTAVMFTTLFTLAQSMGKNMTEMYLWQSGGRAHTSTKQITAAQTDLIAAHPAVVAYGSSIVAGVAVNEQLAGRQVELRFGDDQYAKDAFSYPDTGRMPQSADEIALDTLTLQLLGIRPKLGQQVLLEWSPGIAGGETADTFTLCGWWEGNSSSYASLAWVSEEFVLAACGGIEEPIEGQVCGRRIMSLNFEDNKHIEERTAQVLADCGLTGALDFNTNLAYSQEAKATVLKEYLPMYLGMLLVFLAGYLIIYNIFQISVASDIQFYGRLKTLGASAKQIKRIIYGQGGRLALLGIPAGLLLGYFLGVVLVPILLSTVGFEPEASADPLIFIGSAVFTFFTVITSCMLPARLAGRVSPVEALRYTDADAGVKRKRRKTKKGEQILEMAWSNLWRNKKRTILVISSLTLGMVLMCFFYAKNASFDIEKYLMDLTVADYQIDDVTNKKNDGYDPASRTISRELLTGIEGLDGLEDTGRLYSRQINGSLSEEACKNFTSFYTAERLADFASYDPSFPAWEAEYKRALAGEEIPFSVYGADGLILEAAASVNYLLDGEYDAQKFAEGEAVIAIGPGVDPGSTQTLPTYSIGEKVTIQGHSYTVMAVVAPLQPLREGISPVFELEFILPAETFLQLWPDSSPRKYYFNVTEEAAEEASELLQDYKTASAPGMNIVTRQDKIEQHEAETRSSAVMGYTISLIIALAGILNFVNSMVTAIISRRREFAMIQSIGMTKRQLQKMLLFEGFFYTGLTLAASYVLGTLTVGVIVRALAAGGFSTFRFTLLPLLLSTPVLIILAALIPYLCFRNLEKRSVVERLRETN